jgi:hypothetical protein
VKHDRGPWTNTVLILFSEEEKDALEGFAMGEESRVLLRWVGESGESAR